MLLIRSALNFSVIAYNSAKNLYDIIIIVAEDADSPEMIDSD